MVNEKFIGQRKAGARLLAFLTALALVAALLPLTAAPPALAAGYGSDGKFLAPIEAPISGSTAISDREGLEAIANNLSVNYHLTADIDLSGEEWVPIGDDSTPFMGVFDGQGYVISNLTITAAGSGYVDNGLFGYAENATIKNVGLEGTNIEMRYLAGSYSFFAGGIAGYISATSSDAVTIENCYNAGSVTSGIATGHVLAGGIIGAAVSSYNGEIAIIKCYNKASITKTEAYSDLGSASVNVGGIAAAIQFGKQLTIEQCYNEGELYAESKQDRVSAGGIVGQLDDYNVGNSDAIANVINCYNIGGVFAKNNAGGVGGETISYRSQQNLLIKSSYNTGNVTTGTSGNHYVGGIVGKAEEQWKVENCYYPDSISNAVGSGTPTLTNVSALTTAQMKQQSSFIGFDFDTIWSIDPSINGGYPYLGGVHATIDLPAHDFTAATYGYTEPPAAQTFTVTNNGTEELTNVTAALGTGTAFEISTPLSSATIDAEGEVTVSVRPIMGLAVGEYADTLVITGDNGLSISVDLSFTVSKAPLTITSATVGAKTYDGTTAANVTALVFDGLVNLETMELDTDYEIVSASFNSPDVADAVTVSGTAALIDTEVTSNYALAGGFSQAATITPASVSALPGVLNVQAGTDKSYAFDLTALLPAGVDPVQVSVYVTGYVTGDDSILYGAPTVEGNILTVAVSDGAEAEQTAEIPIVFTSSNYDIAGANITVTVTDKTVVELTSGAIEDKVYDGNAVSYEAAFDDGDVPAEDVTYTWSDGAAPKNAGDYTLTVALTNESDYVLSQPVVLRFAITKAPLTLTADNKTITAGGAIPVFTFTAGGLLGDTWASVKASEPMLTSSAVNTTAGTYAITITGGTLNGEAGANYEITGRVSGTLTISASSWSGGGGVTTSPTPTPTPDAEEPAEPAEPAAPAETITKPPATDAGFTVTLTKAKDYAETAFGDVADGAWYAETVKFAYEYGLFNGTSATQFGPDSTATRAQIITVLARAAGVETDGGANWYDKAVAWAMANGISDGTNLNGNVTREQFATLLWRFAGEPEATGAAVSFTDSGEISGWAETAMSWAVSAGIITGYPGGNVNPGGHATRAEAAAMIKRYVEGAG
jgi:hypothetical protein